MAKFGIALSATVAFDHPTPAALAAHVAAALAPAGKTKPFEVRLLQRITPVQQLDSLASPQLLPWGDACFCGHILVMQTVASMTCTRSFVDDHTDVGIGRPIALSLCSHILLCC